MKRLLLFTVPRDLLYRHGSSVTREIDQYLRQRLRKNYLTEEDFNSGDIRVYAEEDDPYLRHISERGVVEQIRLSCGYTLVIKPLPTRYVRPEIRADFLYGDENELKKKEERIAKKKVSNPLLLLL